MDWNEARRDAERALIDAGIREPGRPGRQDIRHACPVCGLGTPKPFCTTCYGTGTVTVDELRSYETQWNASQERGEG